MLAHSGKENYDTPAALDNTTASDIFQHFNSILFFFSGKGRKLVLAASDISQPCFHNII